MRIATLMLLLAGLASAEEPPAFFGLQGTVTVRDAKKFIDGGSVILDLQDERGTQLHIVQRVELFAKELPPIVVIFPGRLDDPYLLDKGGKEEKALLSILNKAILATYPSGCPSGHPASFQYHAAISFERRLARSLNEPEPTQ